MLPVYLFTSLPVSLLMVECHSDFTYAERPIAVWWEGERLEVEAVEQAWRTPEGKWFRVRTTAGRRFELMYSEVNDQWQVCRVNH